MSNIGRVMTDAEKLEVYRTTVAVIEMFLEDVFIDEIVPEHEALLKIDRLIKERFSRE